MDDECSRGRRSVGPGSGSPARQGQALRPSRFIERTVFAVVRVAVSPLRREEHPKGMEERGAKRIRLPQGYSHAWVWRGFGQAHPLRGTFRGPRKGVEGEKGKEGVAASHVGFALWWSCRSVMGSKWGLFGAIGLSNGIRGRCRIGFVGSVWGFYGFWAIFVVKPPSFCDNSSKFGCLLRFSGFSMPFSVFLGVSVALVSAVGGVSGPVPGSPSPRSPVRRKAAWGPPPGAWPSFLHQMGTP